MFLTERIQFFFRESIIQSESPFWKLFIIRFLILNLYLFSLYIFCSFINFYLFSLFTILRIKFWEKSCTILCIIDIFITKNLLEFFFWTWIKIAFMPYRFWRFLFRFGFFLGFWLFRNFFSPCCTTDTSLFIFDGSLSFYRFSSCIIIN